MNTGISLPEAGMFSPLVTRSLRKFLTESCELYGLTLTNQIFFIAARQGAQEATSEVHTW